MCQVYDYDLVPVVLITTPDPRRRSVVSDPGRRGNHAVDAFRIQLAQFSQHMALPDLPAIQGAFTALAARVLNA